MTLEQQQRAIEAQMNAAQQQTAVESYQDFEQNPPIRRPRSKRAPSYKSNQTT